MKDWFKRHKILVGLLALILLLDLAGLAFVWGKLNLLQYDENDRHDGKDSQHGGVITRVDVPEGEETEDHWNEGDVVNILLVGTDERTEKFSLNARSDSMIILSLNKTAKTIKLVSLQRGMGVPVLEGIYEGQYDWLTHMFRYGGADLLMRTIRECFNVDVSRYVRVNLNTMEQAIDVLGGVDIELTAPEAQYFSDCAAGAWGTFHEGMTHLDGFMGLNYARLREIDDDWHRVQRQRNVIVQCFNKVRGSNLLELNSMVDRLLPLIKTNLSKGEIASLMMMAPGFLSAQVDQMTIPVEGSFTSMEGMEGRTLYDVDFETNSRILRDFLYGAGGEEPVE